MAPGGSTRSRHLLSPFSGFAKSYRFEKTRLGLDGTYLGLLIRSVNKSGPEIWSVGRNGTSVVAATHLMCWKKTDSKRNNRCGEESHRSGCCCQVSELAFISPTQACSDCRANCSRNRNNPPESGHRFDHNRGTVPLAAGHRGTDN